MTVGPLLGQPLKFQSHNTYIAQVAIHCKEGSQFTAKDLNFSASQNSNRKIKIVLPEDCRLLDYHVMYFDM